MSAERAVRPEFRAALDEARSLRAALVSFHGQFGDKGDHDLALAVLEPRLAALRAGAAGSGAYETALARLAATIGSCEVLQQWARDERGLF